MSRAELKVIMEAERELRTKANELRFDLALEMAEPGFKGSYKPIKEEFISTLGRLHTLVNMIEKELDDNFPAG